MLQCSVWVIQLQAQKVVYGDPLRVKKVELQKKKACGRTEVAVQIAIIMRS